MAKGDFAARLNEETRRGGKASFAHDCPVPIGAIVLKTASNRVVQSTSTGKEKTILRQSDVNQCRNSNHPPLG
jgi:hypothetical protein